MAFPNKATFHTTIPSHHLYGLYARQILLKLYSNRNSLIDIIMTIG